MTECIKFETKIHFRRGRSGRRQLRSGETPSTAQSGRVPRVSRLMALAIRFDGLVREGVVADQADLARLGHVTRARVTQIMNLLCLAPDIQEALLFLPPVVRGRDPVQERQLRSIALIPGWVAQRRMWRDTQERGSQL
jgi:hypothetical protein